jgi:hypothetical protein
LLWAEKENKDHFIYLSGAAQQNNQTTLAPNTKGFFEVNSASTG